MNCVEKTHFLTVFQNIWEKVVLITNKILKNSSDNFEQIMAVHKI